LASTLPKSAVCFGMLRAAMSAADTLVVMNCP
jgi:hypothetical protein